MKRLLACRCTTCLSSFHIPAQWHVQKTARSFMVLVALGTIGVTLQALNTWIAGDIMEAAISSGFSISGMAIFVAFCWARSAPRCFEVVEFLMWSLTVCLIAVIALSSDDSVYRHRTTMVNLTMMNLLPVVFGMRFWWYVVYEVFLYAVNMATTQAISSIYGEEMPARIYFTVLMYSLGFLCLAGMQCNLFRALYVAEQSLVVEKHAFESLTSMLCDATCWLASDMDTVVACDQRLDAMIGRRMEGQLLSSCYIAPELELARLDHALSQSTDTTDEVAPVTLLPSTLRLDSNLALVVDLFIVGNNSLLEKSSALVEEDRKFFIGIRRMHERVITNADLAPGGEDTNSVLAMKIGKPVETDAELLEDDQSDVVVSSCGIEEASPGSTPWDTVDTLSVPATTGTGRLFRAFKDQKSNPNMVFFEMERLGRQEHWLVAPTEVKLQPDAILGEGGFGVVLRGVFYGTDVAVKLPRHRGPEIVRRLPALVNELRVLRHARHPNLVQLHGAVVDAEQGLFGLLLELVTGRALDVFVLVHGGGVEARYEVLHGVSRALWYLHSRSPVIVHGDLKPGNVLVDHRGLSVQAKLLDFGLSRLLVGAVEPLGGTLSWMAPEVFQNRDMRPQPSSDVFSFGGLAFFLATRQRPFKALDKAALTAQLRSGNLAPLRWAGRCPLEHLCQPLVQRCFQASELRPRTEDIQKLISGWPLKGRMGKATTRIATWQHCQPDMPDPEYEWSEALQRLNREQISSQRPSALPGKPSRPEHAAKGKSPRFTRPDLFPTCMQVRHTGLLDLIMHWNFEVPSGACCVMHAGLQAVVEACAEAGHIPCPAGFDTLPGPQCPGCGWVAEDPCELEGGGCALCNELLPSQSFQAGRRQQL